MHSVIPIQASGSRFLPKHQPQSVRHSSVSTLNHHNYSGAEAPLLHREEHIFLVNSMVGDSLTVKRTAAFLEELPFNVGEADSTQHVVWGVERNKTRVDISHSKSVRQFCWHSKGDYLAVVTVAGKSVCESVVCVASLFVIGFSFR